VLDRPLTTLAPGLARLTVSLAVVAAITVVCYAIVPVNAATVGFIYLLAVLLIASTWGLVEAAGASIAAVFCFNFYFLPPVGTLTIADPQNWVALFTFLVTSIVASQLSRRAQQRTIDAISSQREMERLYALGRAILLAGPQEDAGREIARQVARIFELEGVALYSRRDGVTYRAGAADLSGLEDKLRQAALEASVVTDKPTRTMLVAIRLGGEPTGSLAIRGAAPSDAALQSVCNLAAISLERVRIQETFTQAEIARRSDTLKSTLLDAIAHEFQTPLTAIRAAASALLDGPPADADSQTDLLRVVNEESARLSRLVREAIRMARIETGKVQLQRSPQNVRNLVEQTLGDMSAKLDGRRLTVVADPNLPELSVDAELIELALRQILDNAVKYSAPGSPLIVEAKRDEDVVIVSVTDRGPGIPEWEQPRIFEKFYRGIEMPRPTAGSGMGLAIAREIVQAHGGEIWVDSKLGEGSRFSISLPSNPELEI
jgi:two-component system sensor histidine kinase KdpD